MSDRPRAEPSREAVAEALVKRADPTKVVAWFCTNCGTVHATEKDAKRCTTKRPYNTDPGKFCTEWACEDCGEPASPYQWYCSKCLRKRQGVREAENLAKAQVVIAAADYPNDQGVVWDSNYYQCLEDFADHCDNRDIELPDRVWATEPRFFTISIESILEHAFEEWSEGCDDAEPNWSGEDELKVAVEVFNKANKGMILYWECNTAVDLTEWGKDEVER